MDRAAEKNYFYSNGIDDEAKGKIFMPNIHRFKTKKNPGVELLSRTLLCSTIVVRPLINRVRDGNVSCKPAVDTGNKYVRRSKIEGEELSGKHNLLSWNMLKCYLS